MLLPLMWLIIQSFFVKHNLHIVELPVTINFINNFPLNIILNAIVF